MDRELTYDEAEAAGFDGTGRDGDPRWPYHESDLIPDNRPDLDPAARGAIDDDDIELLTSEDLDDGTWASDGTLA